MIYPDIPLKALSIMQPWSWLIVNGHKDIENRYWPTKYRGRVAIHAGLKVHAKALDDIFAYKHPASGREICAEADFHLMRHDLREASLSIGGIVGVADIVGCTGESDSEWFVGGLSEKGKKGMGFILENARPVEFIPVKGALGFFDWRKRLI